MAFMPEEMPDPGGPNAAGLGGVAAKLEGMLEDRLRGLPTGRNTNKSLKGNGVGLLLQSSGLTRKQKVTENRKRDNPYLFALR